MSTGGLSRVRIERMQYVMAGHVDGVVVPGVVTLVIRRGEVHVDPIGTRAFGDSDSMMEQDHLGHRYTSPKDGLHPYHGSLPEAEPRTLGPGSNRDFPPVPRQPCVAAITGRSGVAPRL